MNVYLDLDVAVDHERKLYQVQLHTTLSLNDDDVTELATQNTIEGVPPNMLEFSSVPDFRKFVETMNYVRQLIVNGYVPVGRGTMYPQMVLPSKAWNTLNEWM